MQQQLANGFGKVVKAITKGVFLDVGIVQVSLTSLHTDKGITDLSLAGPERLDLRSVQDDATFISVQDVVIAASLRIGDDISHRTILIIDGPQSIRREQSLERHVSRAPTLLTNSTGTWPPTMEFGQTQRPGLGCVALGERLRFLLGTFSDALLSKTV